MVNKKYEGINLKNKHNGQTWLLGIGIILVIALIVVVFFLVKSWQMPIPINKTNTPDTSGPPPVGNPTQLPLTKVTAANGSDITPGKMQINNTSPVISPINNTLPVINTLHNISKTANITNLTSVNLSINKTNTNGTNQT